MCIFTLKNKKQTNGPSNRSFYMQMPKFRGKNNYYNKFQVKVANAN